MREGVRAMFGLPTLHGNVVLIKLRDLLVLTAIGLLMLASAVAGVGVTTVTGAVLRWFGMDESSLPGRLLLGAGSTLLVLAVDVLVFMLIFRLLSGVDVPRHDFWDAALFGGIGLGILKLFAGVLLNSTGDNAFLAAAGLLLGLLVWLNLVSRLTLVTAAWGATVAIDRGHLSEPEPGLPVPTLPVQRTTARSAQGSATKPAAAVARAGEPARSGPAGSVRSGATGSVPGGPVPAAPFTPVVSPRSADRISVVAGAVLGAAGVLAVRTATGAVRSVIDSARRRPSDD
jgi:membrane protein